MDPGSNPGPPTHFTLPTQQLFNFYKVAIIAYAKIPWEPQIHRNKREETSDHTDLCAQYIV